MITTTAMEQRERDTGHPPAGLAPPRVLLIGDDAIALGRLARALHSAGIQTVMKRNHRVGLRCARLGLPDVVVLHIIRLRPAVLALLTALRATSPVVGVLVLARHACPTDEARVLNAGADDYRPDTLSATVICARIRVLLRSGWLQPCAETDLALDLQGQCARRGARLIRLTGLEVRLLGVLLSHADQVLTKEQLLQRVWEGRARDTNVVEVYVKQLRQKLERDGEPRLIHTIRGAGYVLRAAHREGVRSSRPVQSTSSVPQDHP